MDSKEKPASYYNDLFKSNVAYQVHYKDSFYYVHWTQVIVLLKKIGNPRILEIGCGTGQFAEYLHDEGFVEYSGFDFSAEAIEVAKARLRADFFVGNALAPESYVRPFDTVVCLEVLEHIKNDVEIFNLLPQGTSILFSVPNFDDPSHVRWFTSERQIKQRYIRYVDFRAIIRVGNIYICWGVVNRFRPNPLQRLLVTREQIGLQSFTKRIRHHVKNILKVKTL